MLYKDTQFKGGGIEPQNTPARRSQPGDGRES